MSEQKDIRISDEVRSIMFIDRLGGTLEKESISEDIFIMYHVSAVFLSRDYIYLRSLGLKTCRVCIAFLRVV
jgi:hypothetical protein